MHGMDEPPLTTLGSKTPFADLLVAVFNSILEVFLLCAAGYILARNGILDKKTQKQINRLNVSLFTPALLFSKVAFYLTPEKLKELWIIPIWFVIVTSASMVIGYVLGWLFGLRQSQRSFVMAAAMFMNSNALPIALMQSLVVSVPDLAWGTDDNKNAMLGRALTYLTMYSTLGMVVRYSYGVSLLSRADTILAPIPPPLGAGVGPISLGPTDEHTPLFDEPVSLTSSDLPQPPADSEETLRTHPSASTLVSSSPKHHRSYSSSSSSHEHEHEHSSPKLTHHHPPKLNVHAPSTPVHVLPADGSAPAAAVASALRPPPPNRMNTSFYNSFPNSPNDSRADLTKWDEVSGSSNSNDTDEEDVDEGRVTIRAGPSSLSPQDLESGSTLPVHHVHSHKHHHTHHHSLYHRLSPILKPVQHTLLAIHNFMTVPLWAALCSLAVACIEPLKHSLEVHLTPLNGAIDVAGKCAVPLTLVVLGAYFYVPPPEGAASGQENGNGNGAATTGGRRSRSKSTEPKRTFIQRVKEALHITRNPAVKKVPNQDPPRPGESKTVLLAVAARMLITPALLVPVVMLATMTDWHAVFEDPVFVVVNTILLCSPPALTLAQITAAVSGDAFERLISRTIFWSYCIITPPVTIGAVLLGLWLAKF